MDQCYLTIIIIELFSFAVLSTAKEKDIHLCALCVSAVNTQFFYYKKHEFH